MMANKNEPKPNGSRINMGAYGHTGELQKAESALKMPISLNDFAGKVYQ